MGQKALNEKEADHYRLTIQINLINGVSVMHSDIIKNDIGSLTYQWYNAKAAYHAYERKCHAISKGGIFTDGDRIYYPAHAILSVQIVSVEPIHDDATPEA